MISQISGRIVQRTDTGVLIDVHGLCYEVLIPAAILRTLDGQVGPDGTVRLVTFHYHHVEPSRATPILIGFTNEVEREFFEQFITVSGVGPRAALRAISQPIPLIARAIDEEDAEFLKRLPGIGPQRAKEIIAKLQGKVGKFGLLQTATTTATTVSASQHDVAEEALAILQQLQYKPAEAKAMIERALGRLPQAATAEELLNEVYRQRASAQRGFTLLELLAVVVMLGILAAIALPSYQRSIERSRGAEATTTLGLIYSGYLAWRDRTSGIAPSPALPTPPWNALGMEDPNPETRFFDFSVSEITPGSTPPQYQAVATRRTNRGALLILNLETGGYTRRDPPY